MLIALIKFLHLLFALSLFGSVFYFFGMTKKIAEPSLEKNVALNRLKKTFIVLASCAAITGTLLIYPKHYTFHTHWIQAAYGLIISGVMLIIIAQKFRSRMIWFSFCCVLLVILLTIAHDAVTKQTFF